MWEASLLLMLFAFASVSFCAAALVTTSVTIISIVNTSIQLAGLFKQVLAGGLVPYFDS